MNYQQRMEAETREQLEEALENTDNFLDWTGKASVLEAYRRAKSTDEILRALERAQFEVSRRMARRKMSKDFRAEHVTSLLSVLESMTLVHNLSAVLGGLLAMSRLQWVLIDSSFYVSPEICISAQEFGDTSEPWATMFGDQIAGRHATFAEAFLKLDSTVLSEKLGASMRMCTVDGCNKIVHVQFGRCPVCIHTACADHVAEFVPEDMGECPFCKGRVPKSQIRSLES